MTCMYRYISGSAVIPVKFRMFLFSTSHIHSYFTSLDFSHSFRRHVEPCTCCGCIFSLLGYLRNLKGRKWIQRDRRKWNEKWKEQEWCSRYLPPYTRPPYTAGRDSWAIKTPENAQACRVDPQTAWCALACCSRSTVPKRKEGLLVLRI